MATYRIFPIKDSSLYSLYPSMNTGRDEILESSLLVGDPLNNLPQTSRFLIQFDDEEINDIMDTYIVSQSFTGSNGYFQIEFNATYPQTDGDELYISTDNFATSTTITFSSSVSVNNGTQAIKYVTGNFQNWLDTDVIPYLNLNPYLTSSFYSSSTYPASNPITISGSGPGILLYTLGAISPLVPAVLTSGWDISNPLLSRTINGNNAYFTTGSSYRTNLGAYTANITKLSNDVVLETFPISGSWNMGTGMYNDDPETQNGVSWVWRDYSGSRRWIPNSYISNTTASYSSSVEAGGGTWYISSLINNYNNLTQSFSYYESTDIKIQVNKIIEDWYLNYIDNNGFIIKQREEFINNNNYQPSLKYFSRDTHTIYPPYLEFNWDDYSFNTGSSTQTIINNIPVVISVSENPGTFYQNSINKFRINCRPEYPARIYQTSSIYLNNYYLPTSSYYAIQDLNTNEFIVDFDNIYTKISADDTSSYFNLYMNGLEPERYYKIVVKTTIGGSTLIFDDDYYFKVVNG